MTMIVLTLTHTASFAVGLLIGWMVYHWVDRICCDREEELDDAD